MAIAAAAPSFLFLPLLPPPSTPSRTRARPESQAARRAIAAEASLSGGDGSGSRARLRRRVSLPVSTLPPSKVVRCPPLDRHSSRAGRTRFARRLLILLLSKPGHFLPLRVLRRCRSYLSLNSSRPLLPFVLRYPSLFAIFRSHSAFPSPCLAVRLTPQAETFAADLAEVRRRNEPALAAKLQRLLMLSSSRRILVSKLAHIAPDLGLPPDFRSSVCLRHPDRFAVVQTSYGPALRLSRWDSSLAVTTPAGGERGRRERVMEDRPLRFPRIALRRGLNLRRRHRDYLLHLDGLPDVSPFDNAITGTSDEMAEKRACAVVREVLSMTVEKRTLIDHLTHFRKDFGLPNRLHAMLVRHPQIFYVSINGVRHSVFLVEGYDDDGKLMTVDDELLAERQGLERLVRESKRIRRELKRKGLLSEDDTEGSALGEPAERGWEEGAADEFNGLFDAAIGDDWEEFQDEDGVGGDGGDNGDELEEFWVRKAAAAGLIGAEDDDW